MVAMAQVVWAATVASPPAPAAASRLAGIIEIAPYAELSAKATAFGMLIGNPIVPTLLLASVQQSAMSTYGSFRTDAPIYLASYQVAPDRSEEVVVYPSVDRIARMALVNPGSERQGKDVLHLLPTERRPHERYAVFSGNGQFAAFASSVELARRALDDCRPGGKAAWPLARVALHRPGVLTICQSIQKAGVTNLIDVVRGFDRLELALDLTARGLALAFSGRMGAARPPAELQRTLEGVLKETFKGMAGEGEAQGPTITVAADKSGVVSGEILIPEAKLRSMGKDFNSFVAAQMSGALSGETDGKGKQDKMGKKGAKPKERRK